MQRNSLCSSRHLRVCSERGPTGPSPGSSQVYFDESTLISARSASLRILSLLTVKEHICTVLTKSSQMVPALTGVVPAASGRGASPPGAIEFTDTPVFHRVVFDRVGGQSAHFDTRVVTQEVGEGHPAGRQRGALTLQLKTRGGSGSPQIRTRTLRPPRWHADSLPARSSTQRTCRNATTLKTQERLQPEKNADHVVLRLPVTPRSSPLHLTPRVPHPHQLLLPAPVVHLET